MAIPVTIPRLGWNMEEGIFVGWLKQDGDAVRPGDGLFSLEGEKSTEEIEAFDAGVLSIPPNAPKPGEKVAVGALIGYLLAAGETAPSFPASAAGITAASVPVEPAASPSVRRLARERGIDWRRLNGSGPGGRITPDDVTAPRSSSPISGSPTISPRARRAATERGIDWMSIKGSGRTGRIRERDIRAAIPAAAGVRVLPLTAIRKTIAGRMLASQRCTAAVTLTTTADATNLVNLREQFKTVEPAGVPSFTDFFVKFTAAALQQHPLLTGRWTDAGIELPESVHIGIAVDTDAGLMVPVIRDANTLSLRRVATKSRDLIERTRQGKIKSDDLQGGSFTITNLGAFGIDAFTPIINPPECAILGLGRIRKMPVCVGDTIVARNQITLSLTFDHRIADGAPAARFLQSLVQLIENPGPCLTS